MRVCVHLGDFAGPWPIQIMIYVYEDVLTLRLIVQALSVGHGSRTRSPPRALHLTFAFFQESEDSGPRDREKPRH